MIADGRHLLWRRPLGHVLPDETQAELPVAPTSAAVMVPTVAFDMLRSRVPKFAWFRRLKTSQRNSSRALFMGKRLLSEKSTNEPTAAVPPMLRAVREASEHQRHGAEAQPSPARPALAL